jgi:TrmH family RNA methyltransferase
MQTISSRQNPKIKLARALRERKHRKKEGLYLVEGIRHVGELLDSEHPLEYLCFDPEQLTSEYGQSLIDRAESSGAAVFEVAGEAFTALAEKSSPQGLIAVARQKTAALSELNSSNCPWALALVEPQDPGNIGTALRTMDAVGASGLILLDGGSDPWHPTAVRASMGTLFWHPVVQTDFDSFATWAQQNDFNVYGTSAKGTADYRETKYQQPAILLMGSERQGLTPAQTAACTSLVRIPMEGRGSSLNMAIATGIMLYEMKK